MRTYVCLTGKNSFNKSSAIVDVVIRKYNLNAVTSAALLWGLKKRFDVMFLLFLWAKLSSHEQMHCYVDYEVLHDLLDFL